MTIHCTSPNGFPCHLYPSLHYLLHVIGCFLQKQMQSSKGEDGKVWSGLMIPIILLELIPIYLIAISFYYNILIYLIPIFRYFIPKYCGKFINENSKQNADKHQKVFSVQNILWASQFRSRWNISCTPRSHGSCCGQYVMCIFRRWEGVREAEEGGGRG